MSKRLVAVLLACSVLAVLVGCGGGGGGGGATATATGNISGYVYVPIGGTARVANAPAGYQPLANADVVCEGKSTQTNASGYYILTGVTVGTNKTVTISKTGYGTITKTGVTVTSGQTTVATAENSTAGVITLASSGAIAVTSTPPGASIYIDGATATLTTPATLTGISTGNHTISVSMNGYLGSAQTITVTSGGSHSASFTLSAASVVDDQRYYASQSGTDPGSITGDNPIQATEGEKAALLAMEPSAFEGSGKMCTISDYYGSMWQAAVAIYNTTAAAAPFSGAGIDMVRAQYATSTAALNDSIISVYGCSETQFNARGSYRAAAFYDFLVEVLAEATALAFFVDTAEEYDNYLNQIVDCAQDFSITGCVITPYGFQLLASNPTTYAAWDNLFTETVMWWVGHEMGHVNLGHKIQALRSAANPSSLESILEYTLSNYLELQADLFSARFLEQSGGSGDGAILSLYMIALFTNNEWSESHPPATSRMWVTLNYLSGNIQYATELQPVLDNPAFARMAGRSGADAKSGGLLQYVLK